MNRRLGFNCDDPEGFRIMDTRIVEASAGTVGFNVKVIPVGWGDRAQFSIAAVLETYPPGRSSTTPASYVEPVVLEH